MTIALSRRHLIQAGMFGLAASQFGITAAFARMTGFTHGVASGEPSQDSVLLWTRFAAPSDSRLTVEVAEDAAFTRAAGGASVTAMGDADHTAKAVVTGLAPGRWYFYRFVAPDGSISPIGRTRTLPDGPVGRFGLGVFSCSNLPFGYFNAYAHAAERTDLDLLLHLGDYFYEYAPGTYPSAEQALPGRMIQPDHEILALADYRLRYAAYRSDPDLQRVHQLFPMITQWDDHELANDAWKDGAENHDPNTEGDWATRKAAAQKAYFEWMPVATPADPAVEYSSYRIGDLLTLFRTESRITGRDEQLDLAGALAGGSDLAATLARFRDEQWLDPKRSMLGATQTGWLVDQFRASTRAGTKWQVWAQQCVMGELKMPPEVANWIPADAPPIVQIRARAGLAAAAVGLPLNFDSWDGYPVARETHLKAAQAADADLIVLSGDSHNGWAFDLAADGRPAGVEFAGQSVTSPGFESFAPTVPQDDIAAALVGANASLKWANTGKRGYLSVELTPERATASWHMLETIREKSTALSGTVRRSVKRGARVIDAA